MEGSIVFILMEGSIVYIHTWRGQLCTYIDGGVNCVHTLMEGSIVYIH